MEDLPEIPNAKDDIASSDIPSPSEEMQIQQQIFPSLGPSPSPGLLLNDRHPTQFVRSIDQLDQGYAQLFGASAESDPWLLRHCRFDDSGMKHFYKVHFRNAGGVPTTQRIPIHFLISSEDLSSKSKQETRASYGDITRDYLDSLVPLEYGRRLVAL